MRSQSGTGDGTKRCATSNYWHRRGYSNQYVLGSVVYTSMLLLIKCQTGGLVYLNCVIIFVAGVAQCL